jgi:hypothetical protein
LAYPLLAGPPARPLIADFCDWARAHQIRVLAAFPNLCDQPEYHGAAAEQNVKLIRELFASLQVPVIGDYTDSLRPADEFFDTTSHLTEEAMLSRTRRLTEQLKPYLEVANVKK